MSKSRSSESVFPLSKWIFGLVSKYRPPLQRRGVRWDFPGKNHAQQTQTYGFILGNLTSLDLRLEVERVPPFGPGAGRLGAFGGPIPLAGGSNTEHRTIERERERERKKKDERKAKKIQETCVDVILRIDRDTRP